MTVGLAGMAVDPATGVLQEESERRDSDRGSHRLVRVKLSARSTRVPKYVRGELMLGTVAAPDDV